MHHIRILVLLFCGQFSFQGFAHSGPPAFCVDGVNVIFPQAIQTSNNTVYVPFKLVGRLITVEASIDTVVGNFFLDTGSEKLILNDRYFSSSGTTNSQRSSVTGKLEKVGFKKIDSLLWDNLVIENLQADLLDLSPIEDKKKIRLIGVLGFEVFNDYEIFLDYQLGRVVLTKLDNKGNRLQLDAIQGSPFDSIDFDLFGHAIVIDVVVNDIKLKFGLDSGAELNLLDRRVKKKVLKNFKILRRVKMSGFGSREVEVLAGVLRNVSYGNQQSIGMRTLLTNMTETQAAFGYKINGLLGYEFLFNKRTVINYKKKKLYFFKPQMT